MGDLRVELYGTLMGHLVGRDRRTVDFRSAPEGVHRYGLGSTMLSESIPLELVPSRSRADRRRSWFAELLPEGRVLARLAQAADLSENDVPGLLRAYGRDVAGAVQIHDPDQPGEPRTPHTTRLDDQGVADLLRGVVAQPLGNAPVTGKSSLAGVQEKIVLARLGDRWHQVHDGYPSTHILKPSVADHPTLIFDEEYGTRIAHRLGLATTTTEIGEFDGTTALVAERYDRTGNGGRIHQEDFNQVLGARGDQKYQVIGGKVSLQRIARVFATRGDDASLRTLLDLVALTVAVGNLDLHAKNISLLHPQDAPSRIAPAYDVVPLRHQPTDGDLALAVNGVYRHASITLDDIVAEAGAWGVSDARAHVATTLGRIAEVVEAEQPDPRAHDGLRAEIAGFVANLLAGGPVG
ncbi:HipA domain-containing protein [Actinotalea sp. K2]|uniref:HipA domain-containing protein n=1 Tax=Actinotalea sp. K2 TaxID=2939438 RepID=UPI0020174090|nr:HipA domain-containing protein [Actinotalea sp. K2]MCL3860801.1 HipA domain-containing protein [Actinotalea sp. K2]